MKKCSADEPLSETAARNCFLVNQFATPGLGSLMAKRIVAGLGQLTLAIIGFLLVMSWFVLTMIQAYKLAESTGPQPSYAWIGIAGTAVFLLAWLWSLATSIRLLRQARPNQPDGLDVPPRITKPPGGK